MDISEIIIYLKIMGMMCKVLIKGKVKVETKNMKFN